MTKSPDVALLAEQAPARIRVEPKDARANSREDVSDLSAAFGLELDPWQEDVFAAAMGERPGGKWAAAQVAISAPRQNGKSQMIVARALAGALLFGERLIVISAHQQDTARETFGKFLELRDQSPALAQRMPEKGIMNALNRESIRLSNGAVIKFKARSGAGGRGFSSDLLMLDEAQILGARAWASINSTMSARVNPQVWLMGTPPDPDDDSEVFTRIRQSALAGKSQRLAYLEWSAEPTDDPALESTRAKANPAWNTRINHDVVQGEFESYTPEQFARERLGVWDTAATADLVFPMAKWSTLKVDAPPRTGTTAFGVKFSIDGARMALSVALMPPDDGPVYVECLGVASLAEGTAWLVEQFAAQGRRGPVIVVDGKSGAGDFVNTLRAVGVPQRRIIVPAVDDVVTAHAGMLSAVHTGDVQHSGQPGMDAAVKAAGKRKIGNAGGWGIESVVPGGDVVALESAILARHGLTSMKHKGNRSRSTGEAVFA